MEINSLATTIALTNNAQYNQLPTPMTIAKTYNVRRIQALCQRWSVRAPSHITYERKNVRERVQKANTWPEATVTSNKKQHEK